MVHHFENVASWKFKLGKQGHDNTIYSGFLSAEPFQNFKKIVASNEVVSIVRTDTWLGVAPVIESRNKNGF